MLHKITNQFHSNLRMDALNKGHQKQVTIIAAGFSIAFILLAVLLSGYFGMLKLVKKRRVKGQLGRLAHSSSQTHLSFKYETLEKATNYFNPSNKLGQGGAGTVFKGVLPNGSCVAVKRLFFNTRQWMDHFYNEVNLLSGINHKNLVKLLGCSINGPESFLVYEYLPNRSLHHYLSGDRKHKLLDWKTRFNIIFGAAEGLAYLHEESQLRIIHRDVKLSNILLAEDFTAKIADFGLARLRPEDKTHLSTGIAGTLGYMAPEYFLNGKLTEKVDVFSFGVVIIEVMTGRRNITGGQDPFSPLQMVWNLYKTNRILDALDPVLHGEVSPEKMARVLNIGLLCAQASPKPRPSMSIVVKMLKGDDIPPPTEPPFLSNNPEITSHAAKNCEHRSPIQSPKNNLEMEMEMEPK